MGCVEIEHALGGSQGFMPFVPQSALGDGFSSSRFPFLCSLQGVLSMQDCKVC
jgi:hypothetical protein